MNCMVLKQQQNSQKTVFVFLMLLSHGKVTLYYSENKNCS
jgi:hypothetical protein